MAQVGIRRRRALHIFGETRLKLVILVLGCMVEHL